MPLAWSTYARDWANPVMKCAENRNEGTLAGGVTSVICPPDTDPPLDEPGLVRMLRQRSRESAGARTYPLGALTAGLKGEALAEIKTLSEAGCVAFMQTRSRRPTTRLLPARRYAKTLGCDCCGRGQIRWRAVEWQCWRRCRRLGLPACPWCRNGFATTPSRCRGNLCAIMFPCLQVKARVVREANARFLPSPRARDHHVNVDGEYVYSTEISASIRFCADARSRRDLDGLATARSNYLRTRPKLVREDKLSVREAEPGASASKLAALR